MGRYINCRYSLLGCSSSPSAVSNLIREGKIYNENRYSSS